jgi:hypothetical protein
LEQYRDNLFLDDERQPWDVTWGQFDYSKTSWLIVRTYETFIEAIKLYFPLRISLDNDLQTEKEGFDCLKWLCNYCMDHRLDLPEIFFHSGNTVAVDHMQTYVASFKKVNG